jgi:hypothetical protein
MIMDLLNEIIAERNIVRMDISTNERSHISRYLIDADKYLVSSQLTRTMWENLIPQMREAFYLFILMNEVNCSDAASRSLLQNIYLYFPVGMNIRMRLELFGKLMSITNIQRQYLERTELFIDMGNAIWQLGDQYVSKTSIKTILLKYYEEFLNRSKLTLGGLNQEGLVESVLPAITSRIDSNQFAVTCFAEMISLLKGRTIESQPIHFKDNFVY